MNNAYNAGQAHRQAINQGTTVTVNSIKSGFAALGAYFQGLASQPTPTKAKAKRGSK